MIKAVFADNAEKIDEECIGELMSKKQRLDVQYAAIHQRKKRKI